MLDALGFKDAIQRKARAGKPLSGCLERRNQRIVKVRAGLSMCLQACATCAAGSRARLDRAHATATLTMKAACYTLTRLASFVENEIEPFFKSGKSKRQDRQQTVKA